MRPKVPPQGGVLEGGNPVHFDAKNPIILFIVQVCYFRLLRASSSGGGAKLVAMVVLCYYYTETRCLVLTACTTSAVRSE